MNGKKKAVHIDEIRIMHEYISQSLLLFPVSVKLTTCFHACIAYNSMYE